MAALGMALATPSVNVNTAQQSELQSTRGLDKLAAKRIIEYRNEHGPYTSLDDLARVIGADATGRIAEHVRFDGDPYDGPPRPVRKHKRASERQALTSD
ncbi:MAG TPA: helix-hairpin-helix domain-containing protein [Usitatibacter sp.]|nr:helix-hairpin-helix domain-containing protein [Usitatibacter sp.]